MIKMTLKAARINKGLTQQQAAEAIGIGIDTLSNYERGKTYPDVVILKKIEETYDIEYKNIIFFNPNND